MQTKLAYVVGGAIFALAAAHPALAARGEPSYYAPPSFDALDENRNGVLDRGEIQGRTPLSGQFDRFDANGDNRIEPAEFATFQAHEAAVATDAPHHAAPATRAAAGGPPRLASSGLHPTFAALDIDGNGVLSEAEAAGAEYLLDYWDQDHSQLPNAMTRPEFAASWTYDATAVQPRLAGSR